MHLGLLFISQLRQLHSKPWLNLDLIFKFHENSPCCLITASIMVFPLENPGMCIVHNSICQMSSVWLWKLLNTCHSLTGLRVSLWLTLVLTTTWSMCHHLIGLHSDCYLVHALLFYWFTCLILLGPHIDHYLIHASPFNWRSCQIICQIIILNFVLTYAPRTRFGKDSLPNMWIQGSKVRFAFWRLCQLLGSS